MKREDLSRLERQAADLAAAQLGQRFNAPALILPGKEVGKRLVRNQGTGRVLPCCWEDCQEDGDDRYRVMVPHDAPRWPGEKLIYIFCSYRHRDHYVAHVLASRKDARIK
jgi:hypothetical protein